MRSNKKNFNLPESTLSRRARLADKKTFLAKLPFFAGVFALTVFFFGSIITIKPAFADHGIDQSIVEVFRDAYQPKVKVNRGVFAYVLYQLFAIEESQDSQCYSDLGEPDEYSTAICSLKKANVFIGAATTPFGYNGKVTWDFTAKSLCRIFDWTPKKSFKNCLAFAQERGYLDAPLPKKILPKKQPTYEQFALLLTRIKEDSFDSEDGASGKTPQAPAEMEGSPSSRLVSAQFDMEESADVNFFENIKLVSPLPSRFFQNEVYFIQGDLVGITSDEVFAFLCREGESCQDSEEFTEPTTNRQTHFVIPVRFSQAGNYRLGIAAKHEGTSNMHMLSVSSNALVPGDGGEASTNLNFRYLQGKTRFLWNGKGSVARLVISQDSRRREYLFRQPVTSYTPPAIDFADFKPAEASWFVQQDSAKSQQKSIKLTVANFRTIQSDQIQIKELHEFFDKPGPFVFRAKALAPIVGTVALALPNGEVKDVSFSENDIAIGEDFSFTVDLQETGTYIFEVNDPSGRAVVNIPLFVGDVVPLLPDFFARFEPKLSTEPLGDLSSARRHMLDLINEDRARFGRNSVTMNAALTKIAQAHTDNMMRQGFVAHTDPEGREPEDRRKQAKYPVSVGEYLARVSTPENVEAGFMRSPDHRAALLDREAEVVGIGMAKDKEGYLYVTVNYSADPNK